MKGAPVADSWDEPIKILASEATASRISRRAFLGGSAVAVFSGSVLLAACGSDNPTTGGGTSSAAASGEVEDQLNFFHWADYDDPKLFKQFTEESGAKTQIDIYASNEEAIAKLSAQAGTAGYDIVVPTGVYIPQMVELGLLDPMDVSRLKNFGNVDSAYTNQPWDPDNAHSVCKDWGSTGWIYDSEQISSPIETWQDFIDVAKGEASGKTSVLDAPNDIIGLYFWSINGDWNSTDTAELDNAEAALLDLAPHIKAFDSYPGIPLTQGKYALSQVWNGDARGAILGADDQERYVWGLGAPLTELWMDNWCLVKGAPDPNAAYAWIDFILDVDNSLTDLAYHGYNTGINGVKDKAEAAGFDRLDIVFFDDDQIATMRAGEVNEAQQRQIDIWNKMKATAGA
jgi:spermidine/putrescine transport system substrate-binding protein